MKKILFIVFLVFLSYNKAYAECSNETIKELKEKSESIEIYYEIGETEETDLGISAPSTDVVIEGLTNGFYVIDPVEQVVYNEGMATDGIIKIPGYFSGKQTFTIYNNSCDEEIRSVTLKLPKYNIYATDPLCENISGDDLDVCDEWYDGEISYESFKDKVEKYNNSLKGNNNDENKENSEILNFFLDNIIYIILSVVIILVVCIAFIINKRRGALE